MREVKMPIQHGRDDDMYLKAKRSARLQSNTGRFNLTKRRKQTRGDKVRGLSGMKARRSRYFRRLAKKHLVMIS